MCVLYYSRRFFNLVRLEDGTEAYSLAVEVIEESDVMRATDRLVDRIRQQQQSKMFALEVIILIITISFLCNIVADLVIELFTTELAVESTIRYVSILILASFLIVFLSGSTYFFIRRYYRGALGTFVLYDYKVQSTYYKDVKSIVENIWKLIDPLPKWKTPHSSSLVTTSKRFVLFCFLDESLKRDGDSKKFNIDLKGEFIYATLPSFWNKLACSKRIDLPLMGSVVRIASCEVSIGLTVEKTGRNEFLIDLRIVLKPTSIRPESDELIQDIAVYLRGLKESLYKSISKPSFQS